MTGIISELTEKNLKKSLQFIKACARMCLLFRSKPLIGRAIVYDIDGLDKETHGHNHAA